MKHGTAGLAAESRRIAERCLADQFFSSNVDIGKLWLTTKGEEMETKEKCAGAARGKGAAFRRGTMRKFLFLLLGVTAAVALGIPAWAAQ